MAPRLSIFVSPDYLSLLGPAIFPIQLTVGQNGEGGGATEALQQDDTTLVRFSMTKAKVASVAVQGNLDQLGRWDQHKALQLTRVPGRDR